MIRARLVCAGLRLRCARWLLPSLFALSGGYAVAVQAGGIMSPGMLEIRGHLHDDFDQANVQLWSPQIRGGAGRIDPDHGGAVEYGSVFISTEPLLGSRRYGVLMHGFVDTPARRRSETQGELRWLTGDDRYLGIGMGIWDDAAGHRARYAKIGVRQETDAGGYLGYLIASRVDERSEAGLAGAWYTRRWFAGGGIHPERRRILLGYTSTASDGAFRPALEFFRFDHARGRLDGPEFTAVAATLGYSGQGYLSNPARLGRALAPAGLQFSNPVGFLLPTWNHRADTWQLGRLINAGYRETRAYHGAPREREGDVALFPADLLSGSGGLPRGLFLGAHWQNNARLDSVRPLVGFNLRASRFMLTTVWEGGKRFVVTLRIPFVQPGKAARSSTQQLLNQGETP